MLPCPLAISVLELKCYYVSDTFRLSAYISLSSLSLSLSLFLYPFLSVSSLVSRLPFVLSQMRFQVSAQRDEGNRRCQTRDEGEKTRTGRTDDEDFRRICDSSADCDQLARRGDAEETKRRNWLIPPRVSFTFPLFFLSLLFNPSTRRSATARLRHPHFSKNRIKSGSSRRRGSTESKSLASGFLGGRRAACPLRRSHIRLKELLGTPFRSVFSQSDGLRYGGMRPGYFRLHWHFRLSSR